MNTRQYLSIGTALALMVAGVLTTAEAKDRRVEQHFSGTGVNGVIDTNGDGITANIATGVERGPLGRLVFQEEDEFLLALQTNVHCPAGTLEFPLLQIHGVKTVEKTGEQLFYEYTSGTSCVNPNDGTFSVTLKGHWTGGTGRFVGATGDFEAQSSGIFHVLDPQFHVFFSFTGTLTGTLSTP